MVLHIAIFGLARNSGIIQLRKPIQIQEWCRVFLPLDFTELAFLDVLLFHHQPATEHYNRKQWNLRHVSLLGQPHVPHSLPQKLHSVGLTTQTVQPVDWVHLWGHARGGGGPGGRQYKRVGRGRESDQAG